MITCENVCLDVPILSSGSFSLKKSVFKAASTRIKGRQGERKYVRVLDSVSVRFNAGDRVGLIGRNGSGKSSFLRLLAGIYSPTYGKLDIIGTTNAMIDIMIGMEPDLSGFDNIMLKAKYLRIAKKEFSSYTEDIATFSELGDFLNLPLKTYSSGMLLRLSFAIATYIKRDIFLIDEWVSVGDTKFNEKAKSRLNERILESSLLVFASHDFASMRTWCNRAIVLDNGIVKFDGTVDEAIDFYRDS